jgi:hypothetical protein
MVQFCSNDALCSQIIDWYAHRRDSDAARFLSNSSWSHYRSSIGPGIRGASIYFEAMSLRASFNVPWPEFLAHWCLGVPPECDEHETMKALEAVERLWPERLDAIEAGGLQGIFPISSVLYVGQILEQTERVADHHGVPWRGPLRRPLQTLWTLLSLMRTASR